MENLTKTVLVCQGHTCSAEGSFQVLETFQSQLKSPIKIVGCGCLGQCGNGPMVVILPDKIWYNHVHFPEALLIIEQHLIKGKPVSTILYPKVHPVPTSANKIASKNITKSWLIIISSIFSITIIIFWCCLIAGKI